MSLSSHQKTESDTDVWLFRGSDCSYSLRTRKRCGSEELWFREMVADQRGRK